MEIKAKRTLNTKHIKNEDGTFTALSHVGHIHYFNKLGIGDSQDDYRSIDWTLSFDEVKRGWYFLFHNFHPFLPEYADEWVKFRDLYQGKDQTIKYKAVAAHVKGRLVQPEEIGIEKLTNVNCVIYDDAFGLGFDYILYFTRSGLCKVVRIREAFKPKELTQFTWEIQLPKTGKKEAYVYRSVRKEDLEIELKKGNSSIDTQNVYSLDTKKSKVLDSDKITLLGDDKLNGGEWFTYLRQFYVWDESTITPQNEILNQRENIKVDYYVKDGKKYLRKNITAEYLNKSIGDVFTDTTTSYFAGAGDGYQGDDRNVSWAATRALSAGINPAASYTGTSMQCASYSNPLIERASLPFDTSSIGAGNTVTAASMVIFSNGTQNLGSATQIVLLKHTRVSNTVLTNTDYANANSGVEMCRAARTTFNGTASTPSTFNLDATGIANVNLTGYTNIVMRMADDVDNNGPANNAFIFNSSEAAGTSVDPYLSVTYAASAAANDAIFFAGN